MKSRMFWSLTLGAVVAGLLVAGSASQEGSNPATNTVTAIQPPAEAQEVEVPAAPPAAAEQQDDGSGLANAAARPISTERAFPPNLKLTPPVLEVIRLAESGLDESVLMAFVTNSTSLFDLGADEIIYLNDIGVPGAVVAAMIQRDKTLKDLAAAGAAAPAEPLPATATNQYAPVAVAGGPYAPPPAEAPAYTEAAPVAEPPPDYGAVEYVSPAVAVEYSTFYGALAPYGTWIDVGGYGPCWRPTVAVVTPGWRPYWQCGRWIYSDCGWYWLSGYSWGWAPFHYGRWFQHSQWGWCWSPGSVWGPAWVSWRYGRGYCGWAALPPTAGFGFGLGLTYLGRPARPDCGFGLGANSYTFVRTSHFRDHHVYRHALPPQEGTRVFGETTPSSRITASNHRVINHGIPSSRVAAATHTDVRPVAIRPVTSSEGRTGRGERFAGDGRTLAVYRPQFQATADESRVTRGQARAERSSAAGAAASSLETPGARITPSASTSVDSVSARPGATRPAASPRSVMVPNSSGAGLPSQSLSGSSPSPTRSSSSRAVLTESRPGQQFLVPPSAPAAVRPGPEPATVSPGRSSAFTPVIPRETSRPSGASPGSSLTIIHQGSARPSTSVPARPEPVSRPTITRPVVPTAETSRSRLASPARETVARPSAITRSQSWPAPAPSASSRTEPTRSTLQPSQSPMRIERPRQTVVPSSPSPTPRPSSSRAFSVPRSTPAPASVSTPSVRTPAVSPARSAPAPAIRMSTPTPRPSRPTPAPMPAPSISRPSPSPVRSSPAPAVISTPRASTPSFTPTPAPRPQATPSRPSPAPAASTPSTARPSGSGRSSSGPRGR